MSDYFIQDYRTVPASSTDFLLGSRGVQGNILERIVIVPATTSPGPVSIKDGSGSSITIFVGGSTSVADLKPFVVTLGAICVAIGSSQGWKVTTGTNVSVIAVGKFI